MMTEEAMQTIPIMKYTSCGNNFVIVDEIQKPVLTESEKNQFAYHATNINFGVGADNFLVIQPCTGTVLEAINSNRNYWIRMPDPNNADFIFRMFEPDGTEAYSCGNGLMSIANHLFDAYNITNAKVLTEVPTQNPRVVSIGTDVTDRSSWALMAPPRRVPESMADPSIRRQVGTCFDAVNNIEMNKFRRSDAVRFFGNHTSLSLSGYLVFTGEPHLVIFCDSGFDIPDMANQIFIASSRDFSPPMLEKRKASSQAFVDFIGKYFVREFSNYFPVGININFVRISPDGKSLEHRCFERGINHETLACGTGSLASAFMAMALSKVNTKKIVVLPHCCRWFLPDAEIRVEQMEKGWRLKGSPARLFNANFCWEQWYTRYNTNRKTEFTMNSNEGKPAAITATV